MKISRSCFSIILLLLFICSVSKAQEERTKGVRIGYDISRLAVKILENERTAFELSVDYELKPNFYLAAEGGAQKYLLTDSLYHYTSKGFYARFGIDFNMLKNRAENQYEMVFVGLRYGYSNLDHSTDNILIGENYWGQGDMTQLGTTTIQAHWIEAAVGVKAELFKNIFIGWSVRWRVMIYQTRDPVLKPIYIPGYGRGEKKSLIGFNYSIFVRIPIGKFRN